MERTRLELLFDQELLQNAEQARILCGSPVTRFVRSVQATGGVSTVRELCRRNRPSDAFDSLAQAGRLDLSAEASAVKGKYGPLFTDEEVNACLALLSKSGTVRRLACKTVKFKFSEADMIAVMSVLLLAAYLLIALSSFVKCFTVSVGFFNSVLKNSGYIFLSSSSETHTKCSLLLSSVKLSLIGAKASGTFI